MIVFLVLGSIIYDVFWICTAAVYIKYAIVNKGTHTNASRYRIPSVNTILNSIKSELNKNIYMSKNYTLFTIILF